MIDRFLNMGLCTCVSSRVLWTFADNYSNFSSRFCNLNFVFLSVREIEFERRMVFNEGSFRS